MALCQEFECELQCEFLVELSIADWIYLSSLVLSEIVQAEEFGSLQAFPWGQ